MYLSDDLRWLSIINGLEVLLHSSVIILLRIQVIAKLAKDDVLLGRVQSCFLSKVDGQNIQVALIEYVKFLSKGFLMISEDLDIISSEHRYSADNVPFHRL